MDNALELAEAMVDQDPSNQKVKDTYKECTRLVRKIAASVFGHEYKISKPEASKRARTSYSGEEFSWEDVAEKMKKAGVTSNTTAVVTSELEKIGLGNDGMTTF